MDDHVSRFALLDRLALVGFAAFFVARRVYRTEHARNILLGVLVATGAYLGVVALLQTVGLESLVVPQYIVDPTVGIHTDRARGPFTEAGANGMMLFFCAVASTVAALSWRGVHARRTAAVVVVLCALGVLFCLTRAAWIGATAGGLVALLVARETRRYVPHVLAAGFVGAVLAFALIPGLEADADKRANDQWPLWDRKNSNAAALRMIADKPLFGFGWGSWVSSSEDYYRQSPDYPLTFIDRVHNVYLANAVDLGLLGAFIWLAVVATVVLGGIFRRGPPSMRLFKIGLIALAISYAIIATTTPLGFSAPTLLLWTWAGFCWGDDG
jgi:O-antigen ligase